jgi:hypothetical protein
MAREVDRTHRAGAEDDDRIDALLPVAGRMSRADDVLTQLGLTELALQVSIRWSDLNPETRDSIEQQQIDMTLALPVVRTCGCQILPDAARLRLCQYHAGFDDGVDAAGWTGGES